MKILVSLESNQLCSQEGRNDAWTNLLTVGNFVLLKLSEYFWLAIVYICANELADPLYYL